MDYEKLHKDTITKLQEMVNSGKITVEIARGICADFIPESEDEKIRKELVEMVRLSCTNGDDADKKIAWLEKQGGKTSDKIVEKARTEKQRVLLTETDGSANIDWDCRSLDDVKILLKCGLEFIRTIESDKQILIDNRFGGCSFRVPTRYDKGIKQGEQKPTKEYNIAGIGSKHAKGKLGEMIKNLKPVNEVLEQKHAWSEQDEKMFNTIANSLDREKIERVWNTTEEEVDNWFESLKERYTWKPSDEQIRRLEYFLKLWGKTEDIENTKVFETVKSLLNDLRKLK